MLRNVSRNQELTIETPGPPASRSVLKKIRKGITKYISGI